jgi:hypothetical protein
MRRHRRRALLAVAAVLVLATGYGALTASTSRSQLARAIVWGESDMGDWARFPARRVVAGPKRFAFHQPPHGIATPPVRAVIIREGGQLVERDLEPFLASTGTTAFLILRGDTLLYERYFNGSGHDSTQTSMSMAKSVLSALVGIVRAGRVR